MPAVIVDSSRGFHQWHISEVYQGGTPVSPKINVPNVNDIVIDFDNNSGGMFRVSAVDVNNVPTLVLWDPDKVENATSLITGLSRYQPSIITRAFLYAGKVNIDNRYCVYASGTVSAKLFLGTDTSEDTGLQISNVFTLNNLGGGIQKVPEITLTSGDVNDADIVTLVAYTATTRIISICSFLVVNSSAILPLSLSPTVFITDILLYNCPYETSTDLIQIPANVGLNLLTSTQAILHYSNGSTDVIDIDGIKCKLLGINNFNVNSSGVKTKITLAYYPDPGEPIINGGYNNTLTHHYDLEVITDNLDEVYKIYVSANYIYDNTYTSSGYWNFDLYLTNVEYGLFMLLDPNHYSLSDQYGEPFNFSRAYHLTVGVQKLVIRLDMSKVFPLVYDNFTLVQNVWVNMNDIGADDTSWTIDYNNSTSDKLMGNLKAISLITTDYLSVDISVGKANSSDWLDALYWNLEPIFEPVNLTAPTPDYFRLIYKKGEEFFETVEFPLSNWDDTVQFMDGPLPTVVMNYTTVNIVWLKSNISGPKKILGITPLMVKLG